MRWHSALRSPAFYRERTTTSAPLAMRVARCIAVEIPMKECTVLHGDSRPYRGMGTKIDIWSVRRGTRDKSRERKERGKERKGERKREREREWESGRQGRAA